MCANGFTYSTNTRLVCYFAPPSQVHVDHTINNTVRCARTCRPKIGLHHLMQFRSGGKLQRVGVNNYYPKHLAQN